MKNLLKKYILDKEHNIIEEPDLFKWGEWLEYAPNKIVNKSFIFDKGVDMEISTVFLGLDHNWNDEDAPILFETMVFGGKDNDYQIRYHTWDEAIIGHKETIKMVKKHIKEIL